jgi:hypothetical protein
MLTETGSDHLATALGDIAGGLDRLTAAATDTVRIVTARARRLAPVDTGALSRSIRGTVDGSTATIVATVPYARPVMFGVRSRHIPPNPFLFRAVHTEQANIVEAYARDTQRLIEQEV